MTHRTLCLRIALLLGLRIVLLLAIGVMLVDSVSGENWPGWRGPRGDGTSAESDVPTTWDGPSGENIVWKVSIPGKGHSSPVVWEESIFVVSCIEESNQRVLLRLNRASGTIEWQQTVLESPLEAKHKLNSYASGTPVTDGNSIFVSFLAPDSSGPARPSPGEMVVAAYDFDGNRKWMTKPGRFSSIHGFCSSPILYKNMVIVNGDHDGDSYIVALDQATGETIWKKERAHKTRSYVTPLIREIDGRTQMVFSGSMAVTSMDPDDGSIHWTIDGPTEQFVASLVYDGDLLFMTAGFPEHHILAIRPTGEGNVTESHVVWRETKGCSYVPSPIVEGDFFLVAADNGVSSCFDAKSGKRYWMERMGTHYSASLVSAGGLVYFLADDGMTKVVRPGSTLNVVAENRLGEYCYASPAISDGQIFIRSEKHLFRIAESDR